MYNNQFLYIESWQFGGVGSIHLDYDLAPYVKMSYVKHLRTGLKWLYNFDLSKNTKSLSISCNWYKNRYPRAHEFAMEELEKECAQACEGLYHNLNTLESRQGSQVPFTSINLGKDTSSEGRLVTKWLMQASLDGIGDKHITSIFPISIFQYKKGINSDEGDKNYDLKKLALKSMSKRIYPNWCNCDWSEAHESPDDPSTDFSTINSPVA